ncbi:MAG: hypothetical protein Q8O88_01560 [bacterium]|nr:hypothetical protein [bacterium]
MRKLKTVLKAIMQENTGIHFLDSGQDDNRHWQRNQKIQDWDKQPLYSYDQQEITINLYPFLLKHLEITDISEALNNKFKRYMKKSDGSYLNDMEVFIKAEGTVLDSVFNTYNGDSMLSQVLQGIVFTFNNEHYIILQVHTGADVRGGYTIPQVFKLDYDSFICGDNNANVKTERGEYGTDDGYSFYDAEGKTKTYQQIYAEGILEVS